MSIFDQQINGFRYALTRHGDTLPEIAYRELSDAERWPELVWMNGLAYPYITDDPTVASAKVLLSGAYIMVPSAQQTLTPGTSAAEVYGRDCALSDGALSDDGSGDFLVASGMDNFRQQIKNRIDTPRGELIYHRNYGCSTHELKGETITPARLRLSAEYVRAAVLEDYRVAKANSATATAQGDADVVTASITPIAGGPIDIVTRT